MAQRTGVDDFSESARELISTWTGRLKLTRSELRSHEDHEPDEETAWKYCEGTDSVIYQLLEPGLTHVSAAFFEDSPASALGVVYRPEFEGALRAHLQGDLTLSTDSGWYALRKTVYACGCRIYKSKHTSTSFPDIQTEAWKYFQCAMSVFTELLFTPTGLLAVRALCAMVRPSPTFRCKTSADLLDPRHSSQKGLAIQLSSICSARAQLVSHKLKDYTADQRTLGISRSRMSCILAGCSGQYIAAIST